MNFTETITVDIISLLLALIALVGVAFFVGWVAGLRSERRSWTESAAGGFALVCEDTAYRVTRMPIDIDSGFPIPWPFPSPSPDKPRVTHRVLP